VLQVKEKSLGSRLIPGVNLVDGSYHPCRHVRGVKASKDVSGSKRRERCFQDLDHVITPCDPLPISRQAVVDIQLEFGTESLPLGVIPAGDLDRAFPAPKQPVRDDRGVVVATGVASHTCDSPGGALVAVGGNNGCEK
jgi:hypothetical protein